MKINEPIGNPLYGPMLVRLTLGAYLIAAGVIELHNPLGIAGGVKQLKLLPQPFNDLYGVLLPFIDLGAGVLLVIGFWTTLASLLSALMLLPWLWSLGILDRGFVRKEVLLLGASLSLLFSGAGALSIDLFRKSG